MMIDYSVIIRTIGKAGEKYQNLLDSIAALYGIWEEAVASQIVFIILFIVFLDLLIIINT